MQNLKQKVKETTLFSDEDKIAILAAIDGYPPEETTQLEAIIDEFDITYRAAVSEYKTSVYGVLDTIAQKNAASTIKSGVETLIT